jgi:hypothetical protein
MFVGSGEDVGGHSSSHRQCTIGVKEAQSRNSECKTANQTSKKQLPMPSRVSSLLPDLWRRVRRGLKTLKANGGTAFAYDHT